MHLLLAASALAALPLSSLAINTYAWGNVWSVGMTSASNIVEVTTTLTPGTPPAGQDGEFYIFPGLTNGIFVEAMCAIKR